jgi:hypothetical protein
MIICNESLICTFLHFLKKYQLTYETYETHEDYEDHVRPL